MATLLPPAEQVFLDNNGVPLAGGSVGMYVPGTLDFKDTWQDADELILNDNPITLDEAGRAIIFGSGTYRQIVWDANGNQIWDQLTSDGSAQGGGISWGGTSTGTPNAQEISATFVGADGEELSFRVGNGLTNTSTTTIIPSTGSPAITILKDSVSGPVALTGGELVEDNVANLIYDLPRGAFHLVQNNSPRSIGALTSLAAATTTDLGTVLNRNVNITGSAVSVTSFGSSALLATPIFQLTFAGAITLVNSVNLLLPGALDILTQAGDTASAMYLGGGIWRVFAYTRQASSTPTFPYSPGTLNGCAISNNVADATNDIDFAAGYSRDITNAVNIVSAALTKQLDVAWAVGTGAGGLFAGVIANTTYHCFVIMRPDTGVVDAGFSTSPVAADRPAAYTYYRRIGSIIRESATIVPFSQLGDVFRRTLQVLTVNTTNPGTSAVTPTMAVPAGIITQGIFVANVTDDTPADLVALLITAINETNSTPSTTMFTTVLPASGGASGIHAANAVASIPTNTSRQIRYRISFSSNDTTVKIFDLGWIDTRDK